MSTSIAVPAVVGTVSVGITLCTPLSATWKAVIIVFIIVAILIYGIVTQWELTKRAALELHTILEIQKEQTKRAVQELQMELAIQRELEQRAADEEEQTILAREKEKKKTRALVLQIKREQTKHIIMWGVIKVFDLAVHRWIMGRNRGL